MAQVVVFHHARGLTDEVRAFAELLRLAGHTVHAPDLYEGRTFARLADGVAHAQALGMPEVIARGRGAAAALPAEVVYVGLSLGVLPAQALAQTRAGARGAVLVSSCVPPAALGAPWPPGVPVEIHGCDGDPIFVDDGDLAAARALVAAVPGAALHLYPGTAHLLVEPDDAPADDRDVVVDELVRLDGRVCAFLARIDDAAAAPPPRDAHRYPAR